MLKSMKKTREIGIVGAEQMSNTADNATDLTKNLIRTKGTVVSKPFSIASDSFGMVNGVIGSPCRIQK